MSAADIPDLSTPILDWLASPPSADSDAELGALVHYLAELGRPEIDRGQYQRCIELLHGRCLGLAATLRERLAESALPLPPDLHRQATRLVNVLGRVALGYQEVLDEARARASGGPRRTPEALCTRALELLAEQIAISHLAGNAAPYGFWHRAHAFFTDGVVSAGPETRPGKAPEGVESAYKFLLAFAAAHPEGMTGREICWVADFLRRFARDAQLRVAPPGADELGWYWIDPAQDNPPIAAHRRDPPPVEGLLYFSAGELARRTTDLLERLDGDGPWPHDLPPGLARDECAMLLRRVRDYWAMPPRREHSRRRNNYPVQVCTGLEPIWNMLRESGAARQGRHTSEWTVVNESPTGYAVTQSTGDSATLTAGMAVALRRHDEDPWTICVVRWIRTESPEQVELGLQVVANSAKPVTVGFRKGEEARPMRPALVLPPLPALRRQQAVLAPVGTYSARRFMLVSDTARLYIAQGRLLSLDMQTSSVELFQYEIDPYPI